MIKSFKKFIKENILEDTYNSFVEDCLAGGEIDKDRAESFLDNSKYIYDGDAYRVIWASTQEIINQKTFKNIARYISNKFLNDANIYKFFYKTPEDAFESKIYVKNTENKTGIIFQIDAKNAIDLSKYNGSNQTVSERVESTSPILYFEPLNINTIYGKIIFDQYTDEGWTLVTDEQNQEKEELKDTEDSDVKIDKSEESEESEDTKKYGKYGKESVKKKPISGTNTGNKHSKFPHSQMKGK